MSQKQLLMQIKYLRATVAPNIKQQRKNKKGKFNLFSIEEMRNEIRSVLKPDDESNVALEEILMKEIKKKAAIEAGSALEQETEVNTDKEQLHPGLVGYWNDEVGNKSVGVLLDLKTLQPYRKGRHGYVPTEIPTPIEEWMLEEVITDYTYVTKRGGVFLQF